MALHNDILFSAAYAGFLMSQQAEQAADVAAFRTQATAFATAVDTAIPNDVAISGAGGAQSATAFTTGGGSAKICLLMQLCAAQMANRNPAGKAPAAYTTIATAIAAIYAAAVLDQTIP